MTEIDRREWQNVTWWSIEHSWHHSSTAPCVGKHECMCECVHYSLKYSLQTNQFGCVRTLAVYTRPSCVDCLHLRLEWSGGGA